METENKTELEIRELALEVEMLLKKEYNNVLLNYETIYNGYNNKELIKENKLNDITRDLLRLKEQLQNKDDYIYIYFQWIKLIDYDRKKLLSCNLEVTEETYDYFLEVLPPLRYKDNGFYMSEFLTDNLTNYFYTENERFYVSVREFDK